MPSMVKCVCPPMQVGHRRRRALVRDVGDVEPGLGLEQRREQMRRRAEARAVVELARIGLGVGDELRDRLRRHVRADHHDVRQQRRGGDRGEMLERIDVEARIERGRDAERAGRAEQQRVAVGVGGGGGLEADGGARAGAVLDDHLLAEACRHRLAGQPRHGVDRAARRERHDHLDRLVRIGLRAGAGGDAGAHAKPSAMLDASSARLPIMDASLGDRPRAVLAPPGGKLSQSTGAAVAAFHSILMPDSRTTSRHLSRSAARKAANSCGEDGSLSALIRRSGGRCLRRLQAGVDRRVELADDRRRGRGRRHHADVGQHHIVRHAAFDHGRQRRAARCCASRWTGRARGRGPRGSAAARRRCRRRTSAPVRTSRRLRLRPRPCRARGRCRCRCAA